MNDNELITSIILLIILLVAVNKAKINDGYDSTVKILLNIYSSLGLLWCSLRIFFN